MARGLERAAVEEDVMSPSGGSLSSGKEMANKLKSKIANYSLSYRRGNSAAYCSVSVEVGFGG